MDMGTKHIILALSAFGAMIAGAEYPSGQAMVRYVEAHQSGDQATILGVWRPASAEMAAMASATAQGARRHGRRARHPAPHSRHHAQSLRE